MKRLNLNGVWLLNGNGFCCEGTVPGSVYSFLLANSLMDDPFYRDNEEKALALMDHDYEFSRSFEFTPDGNPALLHCDGLDTLCDIYINGVHVAYTDNMHRSYEFDVTELLRSGENSIRLVFRSVDAYIKAKQKEHPVQSFIWQPLEGFPHIRKAHCMLGWDWGPRLPDVGIWRDIYILQCDSSRITELHITQRHEGARVFVTPFIEQSGNADVKITMTSPDGQELSLSPNTENEISNPQLWWPNGLGEQNLYAVCAELTQDGVTVDSATKRIGLRILKLIREKDVYGESFCHEVNGIRFFAMGADYIPEDNILSRITYDRTRELLMHCKNSNFNAIRLWGGGYYPDDFFFDICDELGIVIFMDLMFACTSYYIDQAMKENITAELIDNLKRLRHHASIALICGNNEIEMQFAPCLQGDFIWSYIDLFEGEIPKLIEKLCPYIPYVPSSPTSYGHFLDPWNENYGDSHYWDVWHCNRPFTEYRKKFFRYLSEFGFQSYPCEKTVNAFTTPQDRNVFSRIMELHQKNSDANGKILNYISDTFRYPTNFGTLLYTSQLLQAEAIKYGVEHLRRNRGRCMGTLYWQLNDIWPVASWASIDYYGRLKALHYYAKRFYNPVLLSCMETGERETRWSVLLERTVDYSTKAQLCVTNDTLSDISGVVRWTLRNNKSDVLLSGEEAVSVAPLSVVWLDETDFNKTDVDHNYLSYEFIVDGNTVSDGTVLFTAPKYFEFLNPKLRYEINDDEITIYADTFAKGVEIDSPNSDFVLSDNYFDMNAGSKTVKILSGTPKNIALRSVYDIN